MTKLFANNGEPDQMRSVASDLGLHCFPITLLQVSRLQWVKTGYWFLSVTITSLEQNWISSNQIHIIPSSSTGVMQQPIISNTERWGTGWLGEESKILFMKTEIYNYVPSTWQQPIFSNSKACTCTYEIYVLPVILYNVAVFSSYSPPDVHVF